MSIPLVKRERTVKNDSITKCSTSYIPRWWYLVKYSLQKLCVRSIGIAHQRRKFYKSEGNFSSHESKSECIHAPPQSSNPKPKNCFTFCSKYKTEAPPFQDSASSLCFSFLASSNKKHFPLSWHHVDFPQLKWSGLRLCTTHTDTQTHTHTHTDTHRHAHTHTHTHDSLWGRDADRRMTYPLPMAALLLDRVDMTLSL